MSKTRRIFTALLGQGLAEVINKLLPFLILHVVVEKLGAAGYGHADFAFQLVDLLLPFVALGYVYVGEIDLGVANGDREATSRIVSEILGLKLINAFVVAAVLVGLVTLVPGYQEYAKISLSLGFLIFTTALDMSYVHIGQQRMLSAAMIQIVMKVVTLAAIMLFVHDEDDTLLFALLYFGVNGLISLGTFFYNIRFVTLRIPKFGALKERFKASLPFALVALWGVLIYRYDLFIVEHFHDADRYGLYSGAQRVIQAIRTMLLAVQVVFLSEAIGARGKQELTRIVSLGLFAVLLAALPMAVGVWTVDQDLLAFILSDEYRAAGRIFSIMVCGMVFQAIVVSFGSHVLMVQKETKLLNRIYTLSMIFGIVAAVLLNERFGMEGIAWSSLLMRMVVAVVVFGFARRYLDSFPFRDHGTLLFASGVMGAVIMVVPSPNAGVTILVGALVYGILVYLANRAKVSEILGKLLAR